VGASGVSHACRSGCEGIVSKRRAPWFLNTAVLARLAVLLLGAVLAAYAFQALTHLGLAVAR
jgi:hypothetical protein